jgi:hypothetical protein
VRLFCLALIVLPFAALAGAVLLAQTHWFMARAVPPYLRMLDDESSLHDRHCSVLLFGDSTALTGLEPWVIQQDTHLTTCSIAQTKGTIGVSGLDFLRQYLLHNPAPRVLVLAFSPEDWRPLTRWGEVAYAEGVLQMVRHRSFPVYAKALVQHPNEAFGFATFVYKSAVKSIATHGRSATWPSTGAEAGSAADGHMTLPAPVETRCIGDDARSAAAVVTPDPAYAESLRHEFSSPATQVLLITPTIPDCDTLHGFFASRLDGVLDGKVHTQPIGLYNDSDRHFTAQGAEQFSHQTAALILQHTQRDSH